MAIVIAEAEKVIASPLDVVRSQFVDMRHHADRRVHTAIEFSDVREERGVCRVTARRRVLGMTQVDEIEVTRRPDGDSTLRSVAGSNACLVTSQAFAPDGPGRTRVRVRVELPARGLLRVPTPLLRAGVRRDLAAALEEDGGDLEQRGYIPQAATKSVT